MSGERFARPTLRGFISLRTVKRKPQGGNPPGMSETGSIITKKKVRNLASPDLALGILGKVRFYQGSPPLREQAGILRIHLSFLVQVNGQRAISVTAFFPQSPKASPAAEHLPPPRTVGARPRT
jgi:hypothetical protein